MKVKCDALRQRCRSTLFRFLPPCFRSSDPGDVDSTYCDVRDQSDHEAAWRRLVGCPCAVVPGINPRAPRCSPRRHSCRRNSPMLLMGTGLREHHCPVVVVPPTAQCLPSHTTSSSMALGPARWNQLQPVPKAPSRLSDGTNASEMNRGPNEIPK
jgi:hypothetical protein